VVQLSYSTFGVNTTIFKSFDTFAAPRKQFAGKFSRLAGKRLLGETHAASTTPLAP